MSEPILSIVLPCYNEEEVLGVSIPRITELLDSLVAKQLVSDESFLCFVDDGSQDDTWSIIARESYVNRRVKAIKFSRNFGHQSAILAGMLRFKDVVDCTITIDADLQDDITVIERMVEDYKAKVHIVYGVRDKRATDTFFKKQTALLYYRFLQRLGVEAIYNHADFRLVSARVLKVLAEYKESNLFLRGLFPVLGFKTSIQYYNRQAREAGRQNIH